MSIFGRIYQYCTTHEQTTFTINHHHTTISDNSRLPENMPRTCIQVLFDKRTQQEARGLYSVSALFSSKKRTSPKDFLNADHFKTLRQKEPGTSHIRVLFDKTSTNNQSNFKTRSSSSLFQIARGSGATTRWMLFFFKKHSPPKDPKKRYKVSLQKALG